MPFREQPTPAKPKDIIPTLELDLSEDTRKKPAISEDEIFAAAEQLAHDEEEDDDDDEASD